MVARSESYCYNEAEQLLNTLNDENALLQDIASRHKEFAGACPTLSPRRPAEALSQALPGIFPILSQVLNHAQPPSTIRSCPRTSCRLMIPSLENKLRFFYYVYVCVPRWDPNIQSRLNMKNGNTCSVPGTRDWRSLRPARDLVGQMRVIDFSFLPPEDLRVKKRALHSINRLRGLFHSKSASVFSVMPTTRPPHSNS